MANIDLVTSAGIQFYDWALKQFNDDEIKTLYCHKTENERILLEKFPNKHFAIIVQNVVSNKLCKVYFMHGEQSKAIQEFKRIANVPE